MVTYALSVGERAFFGLVLSRPNVMERRTSPSFASSMSFSFVNVLSRYIACFLGYMVSSRDC